MRTNEARVKGGAAGLVLYLCVQYAGMAAKAKRGKVVRKEENINIRVTAEQKAELAQAATHAGISVSSWMLTVALREARRAEGGG